MNGPSGSDVYCLEAALLVVAVGWAELVDVIDVVLAVDK